MTTRLQDEDLVLRPATPADTDALVAFTADVLRHQDAQEPDEHTGAWTRDLLEGRNPRIVPGDFVVVENRRTGEIVSSAGLISQTWAYEGLPFEVGQPELIGTHPAYRGRGLVRAQLDVLHRWSAERGHRLVAIDGVPWFYRQFGYEMAVDLRAEFSIDAAKLASDDAGGVRAFRVRPASPRDLPFIADLYDRARTRHLLSCCRDAPSWRLELDGRREASFYRVELRVVESAAGDPCAFLAHAPRLADGTFSVVQFEIDSKTSWAAITPDVLHYCRVTGRTYAERDGGRPVSRIGLCVGYAHPVYDVVHDYAPRDEGAWAWYLRIVDLAEFVRYVAPVLEQRLAASAAAGYTGALRIGFYGDGLRLEFEHGRIATVSQWFPPRGLRGVERNQVTGAERPAASFPGLTFLQLLFGYRSREEISQVFPDCLVRTDEARMLLPVLFPKRHSNVWAVL